jgi:propionyl-CoA synthetase
MTENYRSAEYNEIYRKSIDDPAGFWGPIAEQFHWYRRWDKVLDNSDETSPAWFPGGVTNLCYNAVDRHVKNNGLGNQNAIIWEGAARGQTRIITYEELYREVNRFAAVLQNLGVQKGDRVFMFMPSVPETVFAMLACTRIGAIHAGVFTGYGVGNIIKRIKSARPKVALTADGSFHRNRVNPLKDILDEAMQSAPVEKVVVLNRGITPAKMQPGRDFDWAELLQNNKIEYVEPVQMQSTEPSHIVFTSGDTGNPRGTVMDTGGYMVGLTNSVPMIYGARPGDVFWATSDIGWRLGHEYICYGPLLYGITTLIFEGTPDYPDHAVYWRMIEKHRVNVVFSVPTICKMLQRFGIEHAKAHDLSSLRQWFVAGEYCDEETLHWTQEAIGDKPVIDHYWLTEAGWPMTSMMAGIEVSPVKPGYAGKACVGWNMAVVDEKGNPLPDGNKGFLVAKSPLPPGNLITLWDADKFYKDEYWNHFPGKKLFLCGDYASRDSDGYYAIGLRIDEVINVAAMRVSTREIAEAIATIPSIDDVCVFGASDQLKGEEPVALVVLKPGFEKNTALKSEIRNLVKTRVGAMAAPKDIRFVTALPKDRNGKHMRPVIKAVYDEREIADTAFWEMDASPEQVQQAVEQMKKELGPS